MAKRICVTLPHEDFNFCENRDLSPSKLLQERITQIRDECNPIVMKNLQIEREKNDKILKKMGYLQQLIFKWGDAVKEKYGEKDFNEIIEKI